MRIHSRSYFLGLASLAIGLLPFGSQANLVQNGSFEEPAQGPDDAVYSLAPDHWSASDGSSLVHGNGGVAGFPNPQDGLQYENLGGTGGSISQIVNVPVTGDYVLSWFVNSSAGNAFTYFAFVGPADPEFSGVGGTDWTAQSMPAHLHAGFNAVIFTVIGASSDVLIDNVTLEQVQVPEAASSLCMLAMGIGGVVLCQRPRQTRR